MLEEGRAEQERDPAALALGDETRQAVGGEAGHVVLVVLLEQSDQQRARRLLRDTARIGSGAAGRRPRHPLQLGRDPAGRRPRHALQVAVGLRELHLAPLRGGQLARTEAVQQAAVATAGEALDQQAHRFRRQRRGRLGGEAGREQASRHLGMAEPDLLGGQPVAAVEGELGSGGDGVDEGRHRIGRPAQQLEQVAAQVVEAEPAAGGRPLRRLLLNAGERITGAIRELERHQGRTRVIPPLDGRRRGRMQPHLQQDRAQAGRRRRRVRTGCKQDRMPGGRH